MIEKSRWESSPQAYLCHDQKIITGQAVCRFGYSQTDKIIWEQSEIPFTVTEHQALTSYFLVLFFSSIYAFILLDNTQ